MKILSVDPSIDPKNFGWALFENGRLVNSGVAVAGRMANGQDRYYTLFNFGLGKSGIADYLVIDWPAMTPFRSRSNFKGRGMNMKALAMNHQAIGAFLAGMQIDPEKTLRWNSAKHRLDKKLVQDEMISQYRLPSDTPDHITDSIYRGEWLIRQLHINDFKNIKRMEE
jgi:hypothetical protein